MQTAVGVRGECQSLSARDELIFYTSSHYVCMYICTKQKCYISVGPLLSHATHNIVHEHNYGSQYY